MDETVAPKTSMKFEHLLAEYCEAWYSRRSRGERDFDTWAEIEADLARAKKALHDYVERLEANQKEES